jgi:hypothetical protein
MPCLSSSSHTHQPANPAMSPTKPNGSVTAPTIATGPARHSSVSFRRLPSFPSSSSRLDPAAVALTGVRALGNIAMLAFVVTAWLMATHALHVEQRQQQQWERRQ